MWLSAFGYVDIRAWYFWFSEFLFKLEFVWNYSWMHACISNTNKCIKNECMSPSCMQWRFWLDFSLLNESYPFQFCIFFKTIPGFIVCSTCFICFLFCIKTLTLQQCSSNYWSFPEGDIHQINVQIHTFFYHTLTDFGVTGCHLGSKRIVGLFNRFQNLRFAGSFLKCFYFIPQCRPDKIHGNWFTFQVCSF